jgi:hypothetical protein
MNTYRDTSQSYNGILDAAEYVAAAAMPYEVAK